MIKPSKTFVKPINPRSIQFLMATYGYILSNLIESMVDVSRIAAKPCMAQIPDDPVLRLFFLVFLGKSPIPERKIRKSRWDEKNPHVTTALL